MRCVALATLIALPTAPDARTAAAAPGSNLAQLPPVDPLVPLDSSAYAPYETAGEPLATGDADNSAARIEQLESRINELESALNGMSESCLPADAPPAMSIGWGPNGLEALSASKDFRVHIGGRVQVDAVALDAHDLVLGGAGADDAVDFRRARFRIDGTMYRCHSWAAEFDFANGVNVDPGTAATPVTANGGDVVLGHAITDLWWTVAEVPWVGNFRIGNQKDAIGMEHYSSSRYLDFLERSYLQDAFYGPFNNGFAPGVSLFNWNEAETFTYHVGGYKNTQNPFAYDVGDNGYMLTGRLTWLPYYSQGGARLLHLGCGCRYAGLDQDADVADGNLRVRSRASLRNGPPSGLQPNLADTNFAGRLFSESQVLVAPEAALLLGPWMLQTEYVAAFANSTVFTPSGGAPTNVGQVFYQGSYIEAAYFLTGEHRDYDRREPRWNRITPLNNFTFHEGCLAGWGAWQVAARYGFLDLNNDGVDGGYIQDFTFGVNWFWNPFSKMQFNYIYEQVENTQRDSSGAITAVNDGNLQGFGVRFAYDF
jgi:phosphate-selective porin OprO/OprP